MKTMDTTGEAPRSTELSPADDDAVSQASVRDLNLSRRKWMRGAAAVAPMVLTLRSGALAASSLISVKNVGTLKQAQEGWKVTHLNPLGASPVAGDICVTDATVIDEFRIAANDNQALPNGTVTVVAPGPNASPKFYCQNGSYRGDGQQVAILSAASASSLRG